MLGFDSHLQFQPVIVTCAARFRAVTPQNYHHIAGFRTRAGLGKHIIILRALFCAEDDFSQAVAMTSSVPG